MNHTTKSFLIGLICFVLGAVAVYAVVTIQNSKQQKEIQSSEPQIEEPAAILPTQTNLPIQSTAPVASSTPTVAQTGTILGTVGYPSEVIPPLAIYAFLKDDLTTYVTVNTAENQSNFTLNSVPVGTYVVVAYPQNSAEQAGGYSKAVACGLSVDCTDHSLVPVSVSSGQTAQGVEIKDWYVSPGTFPAKPK